MYAILWPDPNTLKCLGIKKLNEDNKYTSIYKGNQGHTSISNKSIVKHYMLILRERDKSSNLNLWGAYSLAFIALYTLSAFGFVPFPIMGTQDII